MKFILAFLIATLTVACGSYGLQTSYGEIETREEEITMRDSAAAELKFSEAPAKVNVDYSSVSQGGDLRFRTVNSLTQDASVISLKIKDSFRTKFQNLLKLKVSGEVIIQEVLRESEHNLPGKLVILTVRKRPGYVEEDGGYDCTSYSESSQSCSPSSTSYKGSYKFVLAIYDWSEFGRPENKEAPEPLVKISTYSFFSDSWF